jgi:hypothetical protein
MPRKIAYLFGAGATHAEIAATDPNFADKNRGLLISDVSRRVMDAAKLRPSYYKGIESVAGVTGAPNIELLISLIENSKVQRWTNRTALLKKLVENDIKGILTESRLARFYLHKGLLTLHQNDVIRADEELIGLISLNYDNVLDLAYQVIIGTSPNYCFSAGNVNSTLPLLKLHGSFNWRGVRILGRKRSVEIIPLGSNKTYIHSPYGAIWNRALYVLSSCDALRVVGCSLSPNDLHLIDLLFKAQLERETRFEIQIIASDKTGGRIRDDYGFFGDSIKLLTELDVIPDPAPENAFRTWLKYRANRYLGEIGMRRNRYLRKLLD